MEIKKIEDCEIELNKRIYLPFVLSIICECSNILENNLSTTCLNYPIIGKPEEISFYCNECEREYIKKIKVLINIEEVL
jgi:hypothetical protein